MGTCVHPTWVMEVSKSIRTVICEQCGHREILDLSWDDTKATDTDVKLVFLRSLPRPGSDPLYGNEVVRKLERHGWEWRFSMHGDSGIACSLSKGKERFRSGLHSMRGPAIVNVAVQVAKAGKFPR
jgi:hypothetical protein